MTGLVGSSVDPILPDLLAPDLDLVLCGTAPSRISARDAAYYANPGNGFWKALHESGLVDRRFQPGDYADLLAHGIGLTDVNKVEFGNDDELSRLHLDATALAVKIDRYRPRILAFTSKNAAAHGLGRPVASLAYGLLGERLHGTELFVLPSTSGQARRFFSLEPWRALAERVAEVRARR